MKLAAVFLGFAALAYAEPKPPATPSRALSITVHCKTTTLTKAQLEAMPQTTVRVHDEHAERDDSYAGVRVDELLARCGLPADRATHHERLHDYLVATGTDHYWVAYSVIEVEHEEHDGEVIVALSRDGKQLDADGELKLVSSGDKRAHRWVRNLASIAVKEATP